MKEAVDACAQAGIGLTSFKTQAGGQVKPDSDVEYKLLQKFLDRGFTDKQAKLKAVWRTRTSRASAPDANLLIFRPMWRCPT